VDSGVDLTHPDYDANLLTALNYDYANNDFIPPLSPHGTSVVGIVAADQGNGADIITNSGGAGSNVVRTDADTTTNVGGIVTTDVTDTGGYNANTSAAGGDYTDPAAGSGFDGISAAAPQVAGVIALMLEAKDQLGWRDVQSILAYSAVNAGSAVGSAANTGAPVGGGFEQSTQTDGSSWFWNAADNWNGGGMHFSNDYTYGLVDALAAVRLAETWTQQSTSANDLTTFEDDVDTQRRRRQKHTYWH
jgi:hypothetical protein